MMISDMEFDRSDLGFELAKEEEEIKIKPLLAAMKCFFGFPLEAGHCCCSLFSSPYIKKEHIGTKSSTRLTNSEMSQNQNFLLVTHSQKWHTLRIF
jgi:hypothetical protein